MNLSHWNSTVPVSVKVQELSHLNQNFHQVVNPRRYKSVPQWVKVHLMLEPCLWWVRTKPVKYNSSSYHNYTGTTLIGLMLTLFVLRSLVKFSRNDYSNQTIFYSILLHLQNRDQGFTFRKSHKEQMKNVANPQQKFGKKIGASLLIFITFPKNIVIIVSHLLSFYRYSKGFVLSERQ